MLDEEAGGTLPVFGDEMGGGRMSDRLTRRGLLGRGGAVAGQRRRSAALAGGRAAAAAAAAPDARTSRTSC